MNKETLQLFKDIDKMLSDLEYDRRENERLRLDIDYMLQIHTITCDKRTLVDRFVSLALLHGHSSSKRFRNRKFKHISKAINLNDDGYLYNAVYNNTSIFELRQNTADTRYELRDLLNNPASSLAVGTIVAEYRCIEEEWKNLKEIAEEIKSYLEKKYISISEYNQ